MCKQDVEKLKLFAAKIDIGAEKIKALKGRMDLKYIIIKVLERKLDEEGKTDEEQCDIFKHMIEDLKFYNGVHKTAQSDQRENGKKLPLVLIAMLIMMVKVIIFHLFYVN